VKLARSWTRQTFGASGIALLLPAVVLGTFVLLALAGRFAPLSSVGQIVEGPAIAATAAGGGGVSATSRTLAAVLVANHALTGSRLTGSGAGLTRPRAVGGSAVPAAAAASSGAGAAASAPAGGSATTSAPAEQGHATGSSGPGRHDGHPRTSPTSTPGSTTSGGGGGGSSPRPAPEGGSGPLASVLHSVEDGVSSASGQLAGVTAAVPPPLGSAAGAAATTVGSTVVKLLNGAAATTATSHRAGPSGL
jgi:hypothetical protein